MRINEATGYILLETPGEYVVIRHAVELGLAIERNSRHPSFNAKDIEGLREDLDTMPIAVSPKQNLLPIGISKQMSEVAVAGLRRTHPLEEPHAREYRANVAQGLGRLLRMQR
jgi:hypothetical protein